MADQLDLLPDTSELDAQTAESGEHAEHDNEKEAFEAEEGEPSAPEAPTPAKKAGPTAAERLDTEMRQCAVRFAQRTLREINHRNRKWLDTEKGRARAALLVTISELLLHSDRGDVFSDKLNAALAQLTE